MKNFIILLMGLCLVNTACERSQFAVTTRTSKNGKVTYAKHYRNEAAQWEKVKTHKSRVRQSDIKNTLPAPDRQDILSNAGFEIKRISAESAYGTGSLIASNSKEPVILAMNENHIIPTQEMVVSLSNHSVLKTATSSSDTGRSNGIKTDSAKTMPMVIRYKKGNQETVRIISRSGDTIRYQMVSEQGVVRTVMMDQVDTITTVPIPQVQSDSTIAVSGANRKAEPVGIVALVFSFLGLVPVFGIPFALISIILGSVSLGKIKRHPEKYTGKGIAIASIVIWAAGLIVYLALLQCEMVLYHAKIRQLIRETERIPGHCHP